MRNLFKRLVSGVVTLAVMSLSALSAFAVDVETNDIKTANGKWVELTVTSEGVTSVNGEKSTNGSIYGYAYKYLNRYSPGMVIAPEGEGKCIMGLTVKLQSTWDGILALRMTDGKGNLLFENRAVYTNEENLIRNIETDYTPNYLLYFTGIPEGVEVHAWVWMYS